jgi:uncharacterized protein YegP (UPF0339 family)
VVEKANGIVPDGRRSRVGGWIIEQLRGDSGEIFDLIRWFVEHHTEGVMMGAKFEVFRGKDGDFRFRLKAANGKVVAHGQGYKSKDACLKGVESIKKNARGAAVVQTDN